MNKDAALGLVRHLIVLGQTREEAVNNSAIPTELRDAIRVEIELEDNIILEPARFIAARREEDDWFQKADRSTWYYWPTLRTHLLFKWPAAVIRSLDETTDKILNYFVNPNTDQFDVRGLVLGYVQSGKTANFTAAIAKAADSGYRLIIVLSGIDNGLRRQTQIRLKKELIGYLNASMDSVPLPPLGRQWHEFTTEDMDGDFQPGNANPASLQGPEPVMLVVKKNGTVLRRLLQWIDGASEEIKRTIPVLVIDDESDLASVDTRGSYQVEEEPLPEDYEEPSVINGLIRNLLSKFQRKIYVAYTATPYANILIPHDAFDPEVENNLYPKDFIVDLPKPDGYFGSEELFGRMEPSTGEEVEGLDVIREITSNDIQVLKDGCVPACLENAILGFVLAGAARAQRGQGEKPATMLIHFSQLIESHAQIKNLTDSKFSEFKDEWRYQKQQGIKQRLKNLWDSEFRPVTRTIHPDMDVGFDQVEPFIGPFFEAVQIRTINSFTGDVLDYEREPKLKAIAIGGNRLSRGLTLEGLLTSFFVRPSPMYDTLMQMGRWFGFRRGYEDLTRIWTTLVLSSWFSDLAFVEQRLREDIRIYEDMGITPREVGMRIWRHPTMQVTSSLKRRFARETQISQSYSGQLEQTFKFPLDKIDELSIQSEANRLAVKNFLSRIGTPNWKENGPVWSNVAADKVLDFLKQFRQEESPDRIGCSLPLICSYIEHQLGVNELVRWTVAVRGLQTKEKSLGEADWGIPSGHIYQISRSRKKGTISLGVVTSPSDEKICLSEDELKKLEEAKQSNPEKSEGVISRELRSPKEGLILIYPISKNSKPGRTDSSSRQPIYDNPNDPRARDLIALAISFPNSSQAQPVQAYWEGTVGWRPVP